MSPLSRRTFLGGAAALGGAWALGACSGDERAEPSTSKDPTSRPTTSRPTTPRRLLSGVDGTLVVVTLYGGNDALNTVAPTGDSQYAALRGALALDPSTTHPLTEGFGLHPALTGTKALWDDDRLAVIHGVGFDGLDRSHFHCMDIWQAGSEDEQTTGWVGRWLDAVGTEPLDAVAVGRTLPLLVRGERRSAAVVPAGPFELVGDDRLRSSLATLTGDDERSPLAAAVASSSADMLEVVDTVGPVVASGAGNETLEGERLADRMAVVAAMIEADLPTRVYAVDLGGFDTHAGQLPTHEALLAELDEAVAGFVERTSDRPVTVAIYSEFGRRVPANASGGSDHGRAGTVLLAGHVRPGHHGEPPPLDALVDGDLATTVDNRAVLGGLLEGVLGIDAADILGSGPAPLDLV